MKHKYMIPLVLCGLMIAMVAPALASDVSIYDAQSRLKADNTADWISTYGYQSVSINTGDYLTWYDFKHHYCSYAPSQSAVTYIKYNNNKYTTAATPTLNYMDSYGQGVSWQMWYKGIDVVRNHTYMGNNKVTSDMTTHINI